MFGNILLKKPQYNKHETTSSISCIPGWTAFHYPANVTESGTFKAWTNLSNIIGDDTSTYANISITADDGTDSYTKIVDCSGFSFELTDFSIVEGIEVSIDYDGIFDPNAEAKFAEYLQLLIAGTPSGTNNGTSPYLYTLNDALNQTFTIGGATELFELTPTYSDLNNAQFGVRFQFFNDDKPGDSSTIRIKRIGIRCYISCS